LPPIDISARLKRTNQVRDWATPILPYFIYNNQRILSIEWILENQKILEDKDILSLIISLLSVVIALMAYFRASKLSEQMNFLTERSLRSGNLNKYSSELNLLRSNLEPKIETLQRKASLAYLDIINKVDLFGSKPSSGNLRHITQDIVFLWFNRFSDELTWQTALNLYHRMYELLHIEPDESTRGFIGDCIDFFDKKYRNRITRYLKELLIKNEKFNNLLVEYFNHLENSGGLYEFAMEESRPIFEDLFSLRDEIQWSADKLDQLLKENEIEEVRLYEAPKLNREIKSYIAKLRILENIHLLESTLHYDHELFAKNQILIILFCLYLIQSYWIWGKSVPTT
jgi:hypothetical protein